MARVVSLQANARDDLNQIVASITRLKSAATAERWLGRMTRALRNLGDTAGQWPVADGPGLSAVALREMHFGRRPHVYRVFYEFDAEQVVVYRVRHAAQDALTDDDL